MITFLAVDGFLFVFVLILIELRLWEKFCDFCCSLYPSVVDDSGNWDFIFLFELLIYLFSSFVQAVERINLERGMVVPAEDDDVLRERELIQSKPISVLQKDNNLVIK